MGYNIYNADRGEKEMNAESLTIAKGLLIPFIGTSLGAMCVFFMKRQMNLKLQKALTGFAAGVMVAASVWSLLIPAMEQSERMGSFAFVPAVVGFWIGIVFLLLIDTLTPHLHINSNVPEGPKTSLKRTTMLVLAVAIHNIPEGMAVGVVYAGWRAGNTGITVMGALALSIGIAIQNFPEGAIVSMPLCAQGMSRKKACFWGIMSGAVEPLAAVVTILLSELLIPVLPYLLSLAAGAMFYVVVEELIPEIAEGDHSNIGTIMFAAGFTLMMALDVALG